MRKKNLPPPCALAAGPAPPHRRRACIGTFGVSSPVDQSRSANASQALFGAAWLNRIHLRTLFCADAPGPVLLFPALVQARLPRTGGALGAPDKSMCRYPAQKQHGRRQSAAGDQPLSIGTPISSLGRLRAGGEGLPGDAARSCHSPPRFINLLTVPPGL